MDATEETVAALTDTTPSTSRFVRTHAKRKDPEKSVTKWFPILLDRAKIAGVTKDAGTGLAIVIMDEGWELTINVPFKHMEEKLGVSEQWGNDP